MVKKKPKDFKQTWTFLIWAVLILFTIIGFVMIFIDNQYLKGSQYLLTAVIMVQSLRKLDQILDQKEYNTKFNLGFIFTVIGMSIGTTLKLPVSPLWALGIILYISAIYGTKKK